MKKRAELADTPMVDEVTVDSEGLRNETTEEGVMEDWRMQMWTSNYVIVRTIISQLDWRDQLRCELVCRLWRDAVKSLQHENLHSYDFAVQMPAELQCVRPREAALARMDKLRIKLHVSSLPVQTRPMFTVGFYRDVAVDYTFCCKGFSPPPCNPPCAIKHNIIEAVHEIMLSKRSCLLAVYGYQLFYMPSPTSNTFQYITDGMITDSTLPFLGLCLPKIPNVNYHTIQYRTECTVQEDVYSVIDDICATDIIKGVVVFVEHQCDDEDLGFLNYLKIKQPSIPYALGGCATADFMHRRNMKDDVSVSMGVFSVPKEPEPMPGPPCQFNMYSLIIDSTVYEKAATQKIIQTFAENISELQFSAALVFSCVEHERSQYAEQEMTVEQGLFRASFPRTTLLGCYDNEEIIGYSYPDIRPQLTKLTKRPSEVETQLMYSNFDSTVVVYFSWGKQRNSGK